MDYMMLKPYTNECVWFVSNQKVIDWNVSKKADYSKGERKMKEVEHAVIVTSLTGGATKFWIKTDRLFDEKSNDLFMYKFILA